MSDDDNGVFIPWQYDEEEEKFRNMGEVNDDVIVKANAESNTESTNDQDTKKSKDMDYGKIVDDSFGNSSWFPETIILFTFTVYTAIHWIGIHVN